MRPVPTCLTSFCHPSNPTSAVPPVHLSGFCLQILSLHTAVTARGNLIHRVKVYLPLNDCRNHHILYGNFPLFPTHFQVTLVYFSLYLCCSYFMTVSKIIYYMCFCILDSCYLLGLHDKCFIHPCISSKYSINIW